jgi:hypothetical protein
MERRIDNLERFSSSLTYLWKWSSRLTSVIAALEVCLADIKS